jgi:hypothetical protein
MEPKRAKEDLRLTRRQEVFLETMPRVFPKGYILAFPPNELDETAGEDEPTVVATHIAISSRNLYRTWSGLLDFFEKMAGEDGELAAVRPPRPHQN